MWELRYLADIYQFSKQSFAINVTFLIYPKLDKKPRIFCFPKSSFKDFLQFCMKGWHYRQCWKNLHRLINRTFLIQIESKKPHRNISGNLHAICSWKIFLLKSHKNFWNNEIDSIRSIYTLKVVAEHMD